MSSALRTVSQIEPTVKFLRHLENADPSSNITYVTDASMGTFLSTGTVIGSGLNTIVESSSEPASQSSAASTVGSLVRDLGRKVTIVSPDTATFKNSVRQVWIQVQRVRSDAVSEGVPGDYNTTGTFWVRTYRDVDSGLAPGGANIEWARLG